MIPFSQEGVSAGIYRPIEVKVETSSGEKLKCRTYQLVNVDAEDKRPSPQYLSVILKGAEQNNLPQYYIDKLSSIEHNGYSGKCELFEITWQKLWCFNCFLLNFLLINVNENTDKHVAEYFPTP